MAKMKWEILQINGRWHVIEHNAKIFKTFTRAFNNKEDAQDYVQRCQMMDRDFAMEGR